MNRLYKFFFLLFIILFALSFIYGIIVFLATLKMLGGFSGNNVVINALPFPVFLKFGLIQALVYSLALLLCIVLLIKKSFRLGKKFTVRDILSVVGWFFFVTTIVFAIDFILFYKTLQIAVIILMSGAQFILFQYLWLLFPIAWLTLFIILYTRIKKQE